MKPLLFATLICVSIACSFDNDIERQLIAEKIVLGRSLFKIKQNLLWSSVDQQTHDDAQKFLQEWTQRANNIHEAKADDRTQALISELIGLEAKLEAKVGSEKYTSVLSVVEASQCANCSYCDIFDSFTLSKQYLATNATCDFLRELLDEGRATTVQLFLQSYTFLPNVNMKMKDDFLLEILELLSLQTLYNPSYYVSHGTDHSVRVMEWQYVLRDMVDSSMNSIYNCSLNHQSPDELNSSCTFILMLNGLLHDIGYINVAQYKGIKKFVHALAGSVLGQQLFDESNGTGSIIVGSAGTQNDIANGFLHAIKTHNNDDQDCIWTAGPNYAGSCTSNSDPPLVAAGYPSPIPRNYTEPMAEADPLSFLIRISDNFDSANNRLTDSQRSEDFMRYLCWLYTDQELRLSNNSATELPAARERAIKAAQSYNPKWDPSPLMGMINSTDLQSFLFFYSVWIVDSLTLTYSEDFSQFTLYVNIKDAEKDVCQHCDLGFRSHPGPGLYQINRLAISMHSLYIQNSSFLDRVTVQLSQGVPGLSGELFPLKQFTYKETYTVSGPTGQDICGMCADTTPLTNSPTKCVKPNGDIVACADITHMGSPYADLSYDTKLGGTPKKCEPHPWWFWLLVIGAPLGGILLIMLAVIFFARRARRQREGYLLLEK